MADGLLDANIFIHAHMDDERTDECVQFLRLLRTGALLAELYPLIVHEVTYVFTRHGVFPTKRALASYVRSFLAWPGIVGETVTLDRSLERWGATPGLSFVDAYLIEVALAQGRPVYTINVKDFAQYGVDVPRPLPNGL